MKNLFVLTFFALALISVDANAQKFSGLDKSPMDIASYPSNYKESNKTVRIIYSRPKLKNRDPLELMTKDGEVWRTGANEAPEITFYKDVNFGGEDVKAGTYALLTMPGQKEWTIILNNKLNQWGSYFYDKSADVVRVKANTSSGTDSLEDFSITFKEVEGAVHLVMGWGTIRSATPITF